MTAETIDTLRRALLQSAAVGVALTAAGLEAAVAATPAAAANGAGKPPGKPGDFDFLTGEWKIRHRRLKKAGSDDWDEFDGEATCWSILGGVVHVEELRIPARQFSGMGLRALDMEKKVWTDFWVNSKSGVVAPPGMPGYFLDGAGIFEVDEMDGERPMKVQGIWDRITGKSHRWYQQVSYDAGKTWEGNWFMDWTKA